jgi:hypothetical protein
MRHAGYFALSSYKLKMKLQKKALLLIGCTSLLLACVKKNIQFGTDLGETSTRIIRVDTVTIDMSTFLLDSFPTNGVSDFLVGRYYDSALGSITAKPFLQLSLPSDNNIGSNAVYDSLDVVIRLNKYYYGDTSKTNTITINELAAPIEYTYNNYLYNTSSIAEKTVPLGSRFVKINPATTDSIIIRLNDAKGLELFNKVKNNETEVANTTSFLNYFKGVSIGFSHNDKSAVYGIRLSANSVFMRLHYHTSTPYPEKKSRDFKFDSTVYFNQLLTDRSNSSLSLFSRGLIPSAKTNHHAYSQAGCGILLKMIFPGLRNILQVDPTVKLLNATLKLKVTKASYDGKYNLPEKLFLTHTDATNLVGKVVTDSTGNYVLYSQPISDNIYEGGSFYSFNVTSLINTLMTTTGSIDNGFFLMDGIPGSSTKVNRVIIDDSFIQGSKLELSLLTLKN